MRCWSRAVKNRWHDPGTALRSTWLGSGLLIALVSWGCPQGQDDDATSPVATPGTPDPGQTTPLQSPPPATTPTDTSPSPEPTPGGETPETSPSPPEPTPQPVARATISPGELEYGLVSPGDTAEDQVTIGNAGDATLAVVATLVSGSDTFDLVDIESSSALSIDPGSTLTVLVSFSPAAVGDYTGVLTLETSDPNLPVAWVPLHGVCSENPADTDQDGYPADVDCDDGDPGVHPGAGEVCDGADQDCNGLADDGLPFETYFLDEDGDGYGTYTVATVSCEPVAGYVLQPSGTPFDCDDGDAGVHPDAPETCDGVDQDCDGSVDEGVQSTYYLDADQDGHGDPSAPRQACDIPDGYVTGGTDCDDGQASVYPGAIETCNERDDDCDGDIDDGVTTTYFADADGDGFGDASSQVQACAAPVGHVADDTDCDDQDRYTYPGAEELCNGRDDDCDCAGASGPCEPEIDEGATTTYYLDSDGDGHGTATDTTEACAPPAGYAVTAGDCDDERADTYPGAEETCNAFDDDCDGSIDEGVQSTYYLDADADGQGASDQAFQSCTMPEGYASNDQDCDDTDPDVFLGAEETCNGRDDDCDTVVDDGVLLTFHPDTDQDGFGTPDDGVEDCEPPQGWVANGEDCDDDNADAYPGAPEVCGDPDLDCDGETALCASCKEYRTVGSGTTDGIYWIDPEDNGGSFPVFCDMTTAGGGWTMVFKLSQGITGDAYSLWTGPAVNEFDESLLTSSYSSRQYVSRIPSMYWNMGGFTVDRARVHLYTGGTVVKYLEFDAQDSSLLEWFAQSRLLSSSWTDIVSETKNYFSIEGHDTLKRRFFINRSYGGCPEDYGWLVVATPGGGCDWELATPGARILYAPGDTYINWTTATSNGTVGFPDAMAVFVR